MLAVHRASCSPRSSKAITELDGLRGTLLSGVVWTSPFGFDRGRGVVIGYRRCVSPSLFPFLANPNNRHRSIGFSEECLGLHYGHIHEADLGDGLGRKDEHFLARQHYFGPIGGTCWESVRGGHHFRAWRQNGTLANSGAWFIGYVINASQLPPFTSAQLFVFGFSDLRYYVIISYSLISILDDCVELPKRRYVSIVHAYSHSSYHLIGLFLLSFSSSLHL